MNKILLAFLFVVCLAALLNSQEINKRPLSAAELKYLQAHKDSVLTQLKYYYQQETQLQTPNKYQPERIALVREYLLQFNYLSNELNLVAFKPSDVVKIVGKPDSSYVDAGNRVYLYTTFNKPYLKLKNLKYKLIFTNQTLVSVTRN